MFGGKDDQFEFDQASGEDMYWIEYDINNVEEDEGYNHKGRYNGYDDE